MPYLSILDASNVLRVIAILDALGILGASSVHGVIAVHSAISDMPNVKDVSLTISNMAEMTVGTEGSKKAMLSLGSRKILLLLWSSRLPNS